MIMFFKADLGTFRNKTMKPLVDGLELNSCSIAGKIYNQSVRYRMAPPPV